MTKPRFKMSTKMVGVIRYFETMYLITDKYGSVVFTGNDEDIAKQILGTLNGTRAKRNAPKRRRKGKTK